jgi:glycosyltransferase involved in cell wall biosynthesis
MRAVVVSYGRRIGGVQSHVELLLRKLSQKGVLERGVFLPELSLPQKGLLVARAGFHLPRARKLAIETKMAMARRLLGGLEGDLLVHAHDPFTARASVAEGRFPVVATAHAPAHREFLQDYGDRGLAGWVRELEARAYGRAKRVIAVSEELVRYLVEEMGIPREKVRHIPNAVEREELLEAMAPFREAPLVRALRREREEGGRPVLFPRRLVAKTGVHLALEALPLLPRAYTFWVAGDGPFRPEVERRARRLGVERRLRLLGSQPRGMVLALMEAAWAVGVPSVPEGGVVEATSIAAQEAMALGTPVVASDLGGLRELIRHGENGLLHPPGDPEELAQALLALEEEGLRERLREEGMRLMEGRAEAWVQGVLEVYEEAWGE